MKNKITAIAELILLIYITISVIVFSAVGFGAALGFIKSISIEFIKFNLNN